MDLDFLVTPSDQDEESETNCRRSSAETETDLKVRKRNVIEVLKGGPSKDRKFLRWKVYESGRWGHLDLSPPPSGGFPRLGVGGVKVRAVGHSAKIIAIPPSLVMGSQSHELSYPIASPRDDGPDMGPRDKIPGPDPCLWAIAPDLPRGRHELPPT